MSTLKNKETYEKLTLVKGTHFKYWAITVLDEDGNVLTMNINESQMRIIKKTTLNRKRRMERVYGGLRETLSILGDSSEEVTLEITDKAKEAKEVALESVVGANEVNEADEADEAVKVNEDAWEVKWGNPLGAVLTFRLMLSFLFTILVIVFSFWMM